MLSLSGLKLHGPKGIGALDLRKAQKFRPLISGGTQERRRRCGAEDIPAWSSGLEKPQSLRRLGSSRSAFALVHCATASSRGF